MAELRKRRRIVHTTVEVSSREVGSDVDNILSVVFWMHSASYAMSYFIVKEKEY